jgi:uncharacterized protein YfiM (DUF2279 family)
MLVTAALIATIAASDTGTAKVGPMRNTLFEEVVAAPKERDAWFGADKFKHFAMSYAVTAFAFAGARSLFDDDPSLALAVAAGSTAGLLKEVYDRRHGKPFSGRDLVWDAAGVAVGFVMMRQTWR